MVGMLEMGSRGRGGYPLVVLIAATAAKSIDANKKEKKKIQLNLKANQTLNK